MTLFSLLLLSFLVQHLSCNVVAQNQNIQAKLDKKNQIIDKNPRLLVFKSLDQQINQCELVVQGEIPFWLNGTLLRIGPGKFETNSQLVNHLFDGFGMVYAFDFVPEKLIYTNRFLETNYYLHAMNTEEIISGFASTGKKSTIQYDNTNVNITKIANHYVALTETPLAIEFDRKTLATYGYMDFDDRLAAHVSTAHPIVDPNTGEMFGYVTEFGRTSYYHVYKIVTDSSQRKIVASIAVDKPSYMHSFALTKDYVILTQNPLVVNPLSLRLSSKAFLDNFVWEPERGTVFTIINRYNGAIIGNYKTNAFFTFHHINAYQKDSSIIIDLVGYDDDSVIHGLSFEEIFDSEGLEKNNGQKLLRYTINLIQETVNRMQLSDTSIEMPRINEKLYTTKKYRYAYGIGAGTASERYGSSLVKIDVSTRKTIAWFNDNCTLGEPVFVACPNAKSEDDGIVLSVVLDHEQKKSFLLILDAKTLTELARAYVPHHIPFGLHGNFFDR